jgi:hypothetical protein
MSLTLLEAAAAKLEGKRVEVRAPTSLNWSEWEGTVWQLNWTARIAPEPKKMKLLAWLNEDGQLILLGAVYGKPQGGGLRVPSEDKEIEIAA